jgi:hypothetical protein
MLDTALSQEDNDKCENLPCSGAPRHAMPRQSAHGERHRHARTRRRPANSVDPLLSPRASRLPVTSATAWTRPLARARPVAVAMADAIRYGHEDARMMTSATDHRFQRADARRDRQDVAYSPASSPGSLRHYITVDAGDLTPAPRPPLEPIKGGHPERDFSHQTTPLLSLIILDPSPLHIVAGRPPIASWSPRRSCRRRRRFPPPLESPPVP